MKKNIIVIFSLLVSFLSTVVGQHRYETLVLQDGSRLEGYILSQSSQTGIFFQAERSYIKIPRSAIKISTDKRVSYNSLNAAWQEWVNEDKSVLSKNQEILLSEITTDTKYSQDSVAKSNKYSAFKQAASYHQVRYISKGDVCEFLDISDRKYHFSWDDIAEIKNTIPDPLLLNGLITIIETQYDQYKGNIISQVPGESLDLLTEDGIIINLKTSSIKKIRKDVINKKETLKHQTLLSETIEIAKNKQKITGVITEQDFVPRADGNTTITIQQFDGTIQTYNRSEVSQIFKSVNDSFIYLYDVILSDGQMKIGPDSLVSFTPVNNKNGIVYLKNNKADYIFSLSRLKEKKLSLYVREGKDTEDFRLMKLSDQPSLQERKNSVIPKGFSFEEFAIYAQDSESDILMPSGTHLYYYKVEHPGLYILYQAKQKRGIVFELK